MLVKRLKTGVTSLWACTDQGASLIWQSPHNCHYVMSPKRTPGDLSSPSMPRVGLAVLVLIAVGLIVVAALLPEYEVQPAGIGIKPLDAARPGWVAGLMGILVQVGLLLVAMLLLVLSDARAVAGGILLGAGVIGLSLRLVRIVQLMEAPGVDPAIGSWVDLTAEAAVLVSGALSLTWLGAEPDLEEDLEDPESELPPPPGEGA